MTTEELNTIVAEVMAQIEANSLDFDIVVSEAQDNDYLTVARYNESDGTYKGLVITWKDVAKVVTDVAVQAKKDAVSAKDIAQQILAQVQSKGTEITNFVATSKTEIEAQKTQSMEEVRGVYKDDIKKYEPIDFRLTDKGKPALTVNIAEGMEKDRNEALSLSIVSTAPSTGIGAKGQVYIDSSYLYICYENGKWKKIALQTI